MAAPATDVSAVLVEGPWRHRLVAAHGARFHVAELGDGPLVLLLHDFPQFWWAWRAQLVALASAGYRAVAMDLRGYGASDKPPRGYDTATSAADVAALVRALGERDAFVVGHGVSGRTAWALPSLHPQQVRGIAVVGAAHPLLSRHVLRERLRGGGAAAVGARTTAVALARQLPVLPEHRLVHGDGVERFLRAASAPGWPRPEDVERYTEAIRVPFVAHSALEYHRWIARSAVRADGRRLAAALRGGVEVPVLQVRGELDPTVGAGALDAAARYAHGPHRVVQVPGAGHYAPEEAPDRLTAALAGWLARF
ncbi:alpha/beta hydrolase [Paenibacillus sp. TRM 82003]|uniref:alpha/beta fold hydrolase n=1 Tax=Kineococcus sp. TRM81007 TaxID=2925831 RepID=UPI001F565267|nr:alpha/beta hydrolase [Kineococcus sp. TRM81007]MCI2239552.1 alpha/beta hydrolase [Kineococcus sp. TRM81007]MCI3926166.1 alpha/beta hydrolase [Paenibacillus sp. TRM 82003]